MVEDKNKKEPPPPPQPPPKRLIREDVKIRDSWLDWLLYPIFWCMKKAEDETERRRRREEL